MNALIGFACVALAIACARLWQRQQALRREAYIRSFVLPNGLFDKLRQHHPQLSLKDCQLVAHGLRQFFLAHLKSGRRYVSMPSQVADDLWHELILHTRHYQRFCRQAFGGFLHHTPAAVLGTRAGARSDEGVRRCWRYVCLEENINPVKPTRLPLLFALDGKLKIDGGFTYAANCRAAPADATPGAPVYCGGDLAWEPGSGESSGGDGPSRCDGGGGSSGSGHHGGSDSADGGSGCGGSSCGGGGCGGD